MEIFKKLFGKVGQEGVVSTCHPKVINDIKWIPIHKVREGATRVTLDVLQNGDHVDIMMYGIEGMNVCLASFLTKGVSYAQEKYNEYKANKDTDAIVEEPKAEKPRRKIARPTQREIEEMKAWAKAEQTRRESK